MALAALAAAVPAGLQIFSALSARKGQQDANQDQMTFNADEAQKQRDFEERMFRNRYQFTRQDLEAAGYNPLLAMGLNPGVPSGAAANANPKSTTEEMAKITSNSAKQVREFDLMGAMKAKAVAEAGTALSASKLNEAHARATNAAARVAEQHADIETSEWGRRAATFRYFMDKTGIGRGLQNIANIFGAKTAAKNFKPNISFGDRAYRRN